MSDYPHGVHAGNGPWNKPDWNGKYQCPECKVGYESEKEIKTCLDHMDRGELLEEIERLKDELVLTREARKIAVKDLKDFKIEVMTNMMKLQDDLKDLKGE